MRDDNAQVLVGGRKAHQALFARRSVFYVVYDHQSLDGPLLASLGVLLHYRQGVPKGQARYFWEHARRLKIVVLTSRPSVLVDDIDLVEGRILMDNYVFRQG